MNRAQQELVAELSELYPGPTALLLVPLCAPMEPHEHRGAFCRNQGKVPVEGGWNQAAIARWANQEDRDGHIARMSIHLFNGGNIGLTIPTGALVLDLDDPTAFQALLSVYPDNPAQQTARGGHIVVKAPPFPVPGATAVEIEAGIFVDLRAGGANQIVAAPSIHHSGRRYEWIRDCFEDPDILAPLTVRHLEALQALRGEKTDRVVGETIPKGKQHYTLVSIAGSMRQRGLGFEEIDAALQVINSNRLEEPAPAAEITQISQSVCDRYEPGAIVDALESLRATHIEKTSGIAPFDGDGYRLVQAHALEGEGFRGMEEPENVILPGLLLPNHCNLLVGDPISGKSSLQAITAMAFATGTEPWAGAGALPKRRVLVITPDDSMRSIRRKYRRLSISHRKDAEYRWAENITVLGLGPEVPPDFWSQCKLNTEGVILIENILVAARAEGRPFDVLILDALLDFLPQGASENSNVDMAQLMFHAEHIAASQPEGFTLWAIHHRGKTPKELDGDVRAGTRGASSIVQKARLVAMLETDRDDPALKTITTEQNEGDPIQPLAFRVCSEDRAMEKRVDYFKPFALKTIAPRQYIQEGESISFRELVFRVWEEENQNRSRPKEVPSGHYQRAARSLEMQWKEAGLIVYAGGKHGSKGITLA